VAPLSSRSVHLHPYRGFFAAGKRPVESRYVLGKPMVWTAGWSVVVGVLLVSGVILLSARLEMGSLHAWSARETQAVHRVRDFKPTGAESVNELISANAGPSGGRWYAFDRPWEHRVYVVWQWKGVVLSFTVHGTGVTPDGPTRVLLGMDTGTANERNGTAVDPRP